MHGTGVVGKLIAISSKAMLTCAEKAEAMQLSSKKALSLKMPIPMLPDTTATTTATARPIDKMMGGAAFTSSRIDTSDPTIPSFPSPISPPLNSPSFSCYTHYPHRLGFHRPLDLGHYLTFILISSLRSSNNSQSSFYSHPTILPYVRSAYHQITCIGDYFPAIAAYLIYALLSLS